MISLLASERLSPSAGGLFVVPARATVSSFPLDDGAFTTERTGGTNHHLGSFLLTCLFCLLRFFCNDGDVAGTIVAQHVIDNLSDLLFQFLDELPCIVFLVFDVAELLFPDASEFTTLKQFLFDGIDELDARRGGDRRLRSRRM